MNFGPECLHPDPFERKILIFNGYLFINTLIESDLLNLDMRLEDEIKQKEFKSINNKVILNVLYTYSMLDYKYKLFFKSYGLTSQQYNILRILRGQHPNPATINLLKERMLDKMSDASRIVERLRLKGLLLRKICPGDRRAVDIIITPQGLELLQGIDEPISHFENNLSPLTPEEAQQLNCLLDKFRN
jgi:DNA-binding MarR family transcriptional regulator